MQRLLCRVPLQASVRALSAGTVAVPTTGTTTTPTASLSTLPTLNLNGRKQPTSFAQEPLTLIVSRRGYADLPPHTLFKMPALSPTMESGKLISWEKAVGDEISAGDVLAEVETDKAAISWEATDDGYLAKILVEAGSEGIDVGTVVAIAVEDQDDVEAFKDYTLDEAPKKAKKEAAPKKKEAAPKKEPVEKKQPAKSDSAPPQPAAQPAAQSAPSSSSSSGRIFASPLARAIAKEEGIDLSSVKGTGPDGRIVKADVMPLVSGSSDSASTVSAGAPASAYTDLPVSGLRKVIASRLLESKTTIPHYYLTAEMNLDELLRVRAQLNEKANGSYKVSVNDFIIKASALALKKVPEVNSQWQGNTIRRYDTVGINVAINTDQGLYSPLIPNTDHKGLVQISAAVKDLAEKAKTSKLKPENLETGTFTISNLGMFGISHFSAVINPPQACILATGGPQQRVVLDEAGEFRTATVMSATLSCDHRVVDGAIGAQWLQHFKRHMEDPLSMLL